MDPNSFINHIKSKQKALQDLAKRKLPVLIGRMAKDHFQNNFRQSGFLNNGLHKWKPTRRQQQPSSVAASSYGPLFSSRNHLFSSIQYIPGDYNVTITNSVIYAPIHNYGGTINRTIHPKVTPNMRRFSWAMFYKSGGKEAAKQENSVAAMWRAMALTKKQTLTIKQTINIPQRQFIGESKELTDQISSTIYQQIKSTLEL